jgi:TM2 domain-containing membrane protein YozV
MNNELLWKVMDIFGAGTVTFVMILIPLFLILLSFGNLKWIPQAKSNGKKCEVAFLTLGCFIAAACFVTFVTSFI